MCLILRLLVEEEYVLLNLLVFLEMIKATKWQICGIGNTK